MPEQDDAERLLWKRYEALKEENATKPEFQFGGHGRAALAQLLAEERSAEREACAKIADAEALERDQAVSGFDRIHGREGSVDACAVAMCRDTAKWVAAAIRGRNP